jgi:hypothetical protein
MDLNAIIAALSAHPQVQMLLQSIQPYLPVLAREGQSLYEDFISYAVEGKWTELDIVVWQKMTEEERDALADSVLKEARIAVDNQYSRNKQAKETAIKVATALLLSLLRQG